MGSERLRPGSCVSCSERPEPGLILCGLALPDACRVGAIPAPQHHVSPARTVASASSAPATPAESIPVQVGVSAGPRQWEARVQRPAGRMAVGGVSRGVGLAESCRHPCRVQGWPGSPAEALGVTGCSEGVRRAAGPVQTPGRPGAAGWVAGGRARSH